jgi:DNA mismatch repair protein MutS
MSTETFLQLYWRLQDEYEDKYGTECIVLIQKGTFYECYATESKGKAKELSKHLNIVLTKANKNKQLSDINPYMSGIQCGLMNKHLGILASLGVITVLVDQVWDEQHKSVESREVSRIVTPGTYIDDLVSDESINISCIYIANEHDIGVAMIDVSVGVVSVMNYTNYSDVNRHIESFEPKEVIVLLKEDCIEEYSSYFDNNINTTVKNICKEPEFTSSSYQNEIFGKVYGCTSIILNIEQYPKICIPLSYVLNHVWACYPSSLDNIQRPNIFMDEKILILHNTAVHQLNLLTKTKKMKGVSSLFDIINKTSTSMGSRKLKELMLMPITDADELERRYEEIDRIIPEIDILEDKLKGIQDIERMIKKMGLGTMKFNEIECMYENCGKLLNLFTYLKDEDYIEFIKRIIVTFENIYDFENGSFCIGVNERLDEYFTKWKTPLQELETYLYTFDFKGLSSQKELNWYTIDNNDKDGYFVSTTSKRAELVKKHTMSTEDKIEVYKKQTTISRIGSYKISECIQRANKYKLRYDNEYKCQWNTSLHELYNKIKDVIAGVISKVKTIDVIKSLGKVATLYGYTRPVIDKSRHSFVHAKNLRHAIVERLDNQCNYIGNDVVFDDNVKGMLLYGMNSSGKSTYGKSIALSIILAQMGGYVPADEFKFSPFTQLFVRINSDDNLFKGMSSFAIEMNELSQIIHSANKKSIVISDELCKGTEDTSATSIVASTASWMLENDITFICATHLHKLGTIECLVEHPKLVIKHLKSEYNNSLNKIIFSRKLEDGQGSSMYGIEIASHMLNFSKITTHAMKIRNDIIGRSNSIVSKKKSRYNAKVYVNECANCKSSKNVDVHHIKEQQEFKNKIIIDTTRMNDKSNLTMLCKSCHNDIHNGTLKMNVFDSFGERVITFDTIPIGGDEV